MLVLYRRIEEVYGIDWVAALTGGKCTYHRVEFDKSFGFFRGDVEERES